MKTPNLTRTLPCFLVLLALLAPGLVKAQALFTDHFDYPTGNTLGTNGWTLVGNGGGGAATLVVSNNLSYSGFAESSGNAVQLRPNGQDWYRTYTTQSYTTNSTASLYYSFLMRVDDLGNLDTTGGYFAGLGNATGVSLGAPVAIRRAGEGFQLGIGKRDTDIGDFSFSDTVLSLGQTILVVGSYNLVAGPINNDFASLWIDPTGLGNLNPPPATLNTALSGINDDVISFSSFTLKPQGGNTSTQIPGSLIFDELRVGNSWDEVALVPEPSLTHMLMVGLLGSGVFLWVRRRRAGL
jgi:hypothetical protein